MMHMRMVSLSLHFDSPFFSLKITVKYYMAQWDMSSQTSLVPKNE